MMQPEMTRILFLHGIPTLLCGLFLPTVSTQSSQCFQYPLTPSTSSSSSSQPHCSTTTLTTCHYVNISSSSSIQVTENQLGNILTQLEPAIVGGGVIRRSCLDGFLALYCVQVYRVCGLIVGGVYEARSNRACAEDCIRAVSEECDDEEWRYLTDIITQLRANGLTLPPLLQLTQCNDISDVSDQPCISIFTTVSSEECIIASAPPTSSPSLLPLTTGAIVGLCIGIISLLLSLAGILAIVIFFILAAKRRKKSKEKNREVASAFPNVGLKDVALETTNQGESNTEEGNTEETLQNKRRGTLMLRASVVHEALLSVNLSPRTTTLAKRIKTSAFLSFSPKQRLGHLEYPRGNICLVRDLWETNFGPVHVGEASGLYQNESLTSVFIKSLRNSASAKLKQQFTIEMTWASGFSHPNIITLLGVCTKEVPHYMIFEYLEYGSLKDFLQSVGDACIDLDQFLGDAESEIFDDLPNQSVFGVEDLTGMAFQVADGMDYLTKKAFVLKDLAARNCQVGHNMTVKIANFGLSYDRCSEEYCSIRSHKSAPVPLRWLPPEAIRYNKISVYSDIWSFGVLLWEIFTFGARPYSDLSNAEVVNDVLNGRVLSCPDRCPQDVYNLMLGCWNATPNKRPWFSTISKELVKIPERMGMKSFGGAPPTPELARATRTSMAS